MVPPQEDKALSEPHDIPEIPASLHIGAGASVPLRTVPEDRYVDFVPVGEGGMGIVYWALDSELKRQVAFKVIRPPAEARTSDVTPALPFDLRTPGHDDERMEAFDEMTARFLQEAWVTGGMEHPGIVPVYDLGRTAAGVPYYTMKFVRGSRTLATEIETARSGGLNARLALLEPFLRVCDTIRYAHSRGVVHRDIKPDNVALGEFGEVVVLDWGLAKLSGEEEAHQSRWQGDLKEFRDASRLETSASAVGTPGYMAPEAAAGLIADLDERSDVYSLGTMLFEILAGKRAHTFRTFYEYRDLVVDQEPPELGGAAPDVPAELAAICADAMACRRKDRTPDVATLAAALRAWQAQWRADAELAGLLREADARLGAAEELGGDSLLRSLDAAALACGRALELRPGDSGARERLARVDAARARGIAEREHAARGRILRRTGAAVLSLAAISAVVVAGILEARRQEAEDARAAATAAQARAVADRTRAEGVMGFMVGEMQDSLEPLGRLDLLAKIGREARTYYEGLPLADRHPTSLRNGTAALRNLGDVLSAQGNLPDAKRAYEASVAMAEALVASGGGAADADRLLSEARLGTGRVLIAQGYPAQAVDMLRTHLDGVRKRLEANPDSRGQRAALAEAHDLLCRAHTGTLDADAALAASGRALEIAEDLAREDDEHGTHNRAVARYLLTPMRVLRMRGRGRESLDRSTRALGIARAWRTKKAGDVRWEHVEADALLASALYHEGAGEHAEAMARYELARQGFERLRGLDPGNSVYRSHLSHISHRTGHCILALEKGKGHQTEEVRSHYPYWRRAYETRKALVELDESNATWIHAMIGLCDRMSHVEHQTTGDPLRVEAYRDEALAWSRKLMECDEQNVLWQHLYAYALYQHAQRQLVLHRERSLGRLKEAMAICRRIAPDHPDGLLELAVLHSWAGDLVRSSLPRADQHALDHAAEVLLEKAYDHAGDERSLNATLLSVTLRIARWLTEGPEDERAEAAARVAKGTELCEHSLELFAGDADDVLQFRAMQRGFEGLEKKLLAKGEGD